MANALTPALHIRPAVASDQAFLAQLYRSTREDLLALAADPAFIASLVDMQQQMQMAGYRNAFPDALYQILECDGVAAGRLVTAVVDGALRVIDLAVLPAWRGRGVAREALRYLQQQAALAGRDVTLSVNLDNAGARRLYASLAFMPEAQDALSQQLRWRADARASDAP